ncbi:MAG: hypothetical protein M3N41_11340 [Acidobacteriota bacterium]|nr:hypothetical protein [Acidobacteriota bacterium]
MISILGQPEPRPDLEPKPTLPPKPDTPAAVTLSRWILLPGIALIIIGALVFAYAMATKTEGVGSVAYAFILIMISWAVGGVGILFVLVDVTLRFINRFRKVA